MTANKWGALGSRGAGESQGANGVSFQGDRGFDGLPGLPGEKGQQVSEPLYPWPHNISIHPRSTMSLWSPDPLQPLHFWGMLCTPISPLHSPLPHFRVTLAGWGCQAPLGKMAGR